MLKGKEAGILFFFLIVVILVLLISATYLILKGKEGRKEIKEISIEEIKFCSYIDEKYNCIKQPNATYKAGDTVWVYIRLVNFTQIQTKDGWLIEVSGHITTRDLNGNIIPSLTKESVIDIVEFSEKRQNYLLSKIRLDTSPLLIPGVYTVEINLTDRVSDESNVWLGGFGLK